MSARRKSLSFNSLNISPFALLFSFCNFFSRRPGASVSFTVTVCVFVCVTELIHVAFNNEITIHSNNNNDTTVYRVYSVTNATLVLAPHIIQLGVRQSKLCTNNFSRKFSISLVSATRLTPCTSDFPQRSNKSGGASYDLFCTLNRMEWRSKWNEFAGNDFIAYSSI